MSRSKTVQRIRHYRRDPVLYALLLALIIVIALGDERTAPTTSEYSTGAQ